MIKKDGCYVVRNSYKVVKKLKHYDNLNNFSNFDFTDRFHSIKIKDLFDITMGLFTRYVHLE